MKMPGVLCNLMISLRVKRRVLKTVERSALMYGAGDKYRRKKLDGVQIKMRKIYRQK